MTEMPLPVARLGKVGVFDHDVRMHAAQNLEVGAMFVQHDKLRIAVRF